MQDADVYVVFWAPCMFRIWGLWFGGSRSHRVDLLPFVGGARGLKVPGSGQRR